MFRTTSPKLQVSLACECNGPKDRSTFVFVEMKSSDVFTETIPPIRVELAFHNCLVDSYHEFGFKAMMKRWKTLTKDYTWMLVKENDRVVEKTKDFTKRRDSQMVEWAVVDEQDKRDVLDELHKFERLIGQ